MRKSDFLALFEHLIQRLGPISQIESGRDIEMGTIAGGMVVSQWRNTQKNIPDFDTYIPAKREFLLVQENLNKIHQQINNNKERMTLIEIGQSAIAQRALRASLTKLDEIFETQIARTTHTYSFTNAVDSMGALLMQLEEIKNSLKAYDQYTAEIQQFFISEEQYIKEKSYRDFFASHEQYFKEILDALDKAYEKTTSARNKDSGYKRALDFIGRYQTFCQLLNTKYSDEGDTRTATEQIINAKLYHHNNYKKFKKLDPKTKKVVFEVSKIEMMHSGIANAIIQYVGIFKNAQAHESTAPGTLREFFDHHNDLCMEGSTELADWADEKFFRKASKIATIIAFVKANGENDIIDFIKNTQYDTIQTLKNSKLADFYKIFASYMMARHSALVNRIEELQNNAEILVLLSAEIKDEAMRPKIVLIMKAYLVSIGMMDCDDRNSKEKVEGLCLGTTI